MFEDILVIVMLVIALLLALFLFGILGFILICRCFEEIEGYDEHPSYSRGKDEVDHEL